MKIITRTEAKQQGLKKYFTGKPCKYGHVSIRNTNDGSCDQCSHERSTSAKALAHSRDHYQKNKQDYVDRANQWANDNPEKAAASKKKTWIKHRRTYLERHHTKRLEYNMKRRALKNKHATPVWANKEAIVDVYMLCRNTNTTSDVKHNVDHIVPLQGKNVCGLHVEYNLRVITEQENLSKGNQWDPDDPNGIASFV